MNAPVAALVSPTTPTLALRGGAACLGALLRHVDFSSTMVREVAWSDDAGPDTRRSVRCCPPMVARQPRDHASRSRMRAPSSASSRHDVLVQLSKRTVKLKWGWPHGGSPGTSLARVSRDKCFKSPSSRGARTRRAMRRSRRKRPHMRFQQRGLARFVLEPRALLLLARVPAACSIDPTHHQVASARALELSEGIVLRIVLGAVATGILAEMVAALVYITNPPPTRQSSPTSASTTHFALRATRRLFYAFDGSPRREQASNRASISY